jgi:hypothetical protein
MISKRLLLGLMLRTETVVKECLKERWIVQTCSSDSPESEISSSSLAGLPLLFEGNTEATDSISSLDSRRALTRL